MKNEWINEQLNEQAKHSTLGKGTVVERNNNNKKKLQVRMQGKGIL